MLGVMFTEDSLTIPVARGYLINTLVLITALTGVPVIGLVTFMWLNGFNVAVAIGAVGIVIVTPWILRRIWQTASKQAIHLHPDKIVFDYITYEQEFPIQSACDWIVKEEKGNWRIESQFDQSFKLVPKSAFPQFKDEVEQFYASRT